MSESTLSKFEYGLTMAHQAMVRWMQRGMSWAVYNSTWREMMNLEVKIMEIGGELTSSELLIDSCVAAGYTGRDQKSVRQHIEELEQLGVAAPYAIPAMYWISPARIGGADRVVVVGDKTSPEVEFFLAFDADGGGYVTVASDHTDRALEKVSVSKAKQICDKVIGDTFWRLEDVGPKWDSISISSQVLDGGQWREYQNGRLSDILPYDKLLQLVQAEKDCGSSPAIFSGTVPVAGGEVCYTSGCRIALADDTLNRQIVKEYTITMLPDRS